MPTLAHNSLGMGNSLGPFGLAPVIPPLRSPPQHQQPQVRQCLMPEANLLLPGESLPPKALLTPVPRLVTAKQLLL
jgi:hypothetical protein